MVTYVLLLLLWTQDLVQRINERIARRSLRRFGFQWLWLLSGGHLEKILIKVEGHGFVLWRGQLRIDVANGRVKAGAGLVRVGTALPRS